MSFKQVILLVKILELEARMHNVRVQGFCSYLTKAHCVSFTRSTFTAVSENNHFVPTT
jgi:hypothetical protein